MPDDHSPVFLLASGDATLFTEIQTALTNAGAHVEIVATAEAALAAMIAPHPPIIALLDASLPDMEMKQLLTDAMEKGGGKRFPIVVISETLSPEWLDRIADGLIDDIIPRSSELTYWRLRLDMALGTYLRMREVEQLRQIAERSPQLDHLTAVYNRKAMLVHLFRETNRVQRLHNSLCVTIFDIDDFGYWNQQLGTDVCDELLCQVADRAMHQLRCYDLLGRLDDDKFIIALPGCLTANASTMAERLRNQIFGEPFVVAGQSIRLTACFGIAASYGRAPMQVLSEAEEALQSAKAAGPESIQFWGECAQLAPKPIALVINTAHENALAATGTDGKKR